MITIVLCTSGQRSSVLGCLGSLAALPGSDYEVVVVENCPESSMVDGAFEMPRVRFIHEPRGGLDVARNRGVAEARGDIVAFIDDDCEADRGWLHALRRAFEEGSVAFVTGRVVPFSLKRRSERCFEAWFSFDRGELPRRSRDLGDGWHHIVPSYLGTGCNMAFRREALVDLGGFDAALDMGSVIPGGGDLDMFGRMLRAGHRAGYAPGALVRHHHRATMAAVTRQFFGYGVAEGALASKSWRDPDLRVSAIRFWRKRVRRVASATLRRLAGRHDPPAWLFAVELLGLLIGPALYRVSRFRARDWRPSTGDPVYAVDSTTSNANGSGSRVAAGRR